MQRRFLLVVLLCICACSRRADNADVGATSPPKPQQAGQPIDPFEVAARVAAARAAAAVGNQAEVAHQLDAMQDDFRRAIKLADPARKVDRESARIAAKRVPGVRSAVWIDRENLLAIVDSNQARTYATIDAICVALEPLGDTLGVVVNLQSGAAVTGDELEIVSRNCQLAPGDHALLQQARQVDVLAPEVRARQKAANALSGDDRAAEAEASLRVLEASTPQMQHPESR
jgi:hypothetical protein